MKRFAAILLLAFLAINAIGQTPKPTPRRSPKPTPQATPQPTPEELSPKDEFERIKALTDAAERVAALKSFLEKFPDSEHTYEALQRLVDGRAELAETKIKSGDVNGAVELLSIAIKEAPTPVPDALFANVMMRFPTALYALGQRGTAFDVAKLIEEKVAASAPQLLELAKFYITVQYGTEAIRLAEKSITIDPAPASSHTTLAIAYKMNFRLADAADEFAKSLEIESAQPLVRQKLAELKRALGKSDEAIALYREALALDSTDKVSRTGLILTLFEAGQTADADAELKLALAENPTNAALFSGLAYWYASKGDGAKSLEYADQAIAFEKSDIWAYVAQARAYMLLKKPLEAERVLLTARRLGDLPTLDYELASARYAAGFFREAADTLKRNFAVNKNGLIETYLGNRILADADSFTELLSLERLTVTSARRAADDANIARGLKALLVMQQKFDSADTTEADLGAAVDDFTNGSDSLALHRELYAANRLLQKKTAYPKVLELMQAAVKNVDTALNVPAPSAAVLADELYDSRQYFLSRGQLATVNEIPRPRLSAILRGRIEETAASALFEQKESAQAIVRLKRALTVLPEKSTWWRSSWRKLGIAYLAENNEAEALEAFIKAYDQDQPDKATRASLAELWVKVNGSIDGLDKRIGPDPFDENVAKTEPSPTPEPTPTPKFELPRNLPLDPIAKPGPTPTPEATPEASPSPTPEMTPTPETTPEASPTPTPESTPEASPSPTPETTPEASPSPTPETTPEASPTPTPETTPEASPSPTPETTPTPEASPTPTPETTPEASPSPTPESSPTPTPAPTSADSTVSTNKPLFDPIIITVGKPNTAEVRKPEVPANAIPNIETPNSETAKADPTGEVRPRIIAETTITPCTLVASQENISVIAGGGSLGVLVGFEDIDHDPTQITAESSSAEDVEVAADRSIGFSSRRAFYVIKSISGKTGDFKVTFRAPCGKKEIQVKVR